MRQTIMKMALTADEITPERDRYIQELGRQRMGYLILPTLLNLLHLTWITLLDDDQSPAIRRTGHQSFVSRLADDDDWTDDTESESEASAEKTVAPRSIYTVTATEPADFFEEYWQTQEYAGDRQFEDYDDWLCEDYDACDADRDVGENDDEDSTEGTIVGRQ